jgi:hypothetical protein
MLVTSLNSAEGFGETANGGVSLRYQPFAGFCFPAAESFFFCLIELDFTSFWDFFFRFDFGDLSPIMLIKFL